MSDDTVDSIGIDTEEGADCGLMTGIDRLQALQSFNAHLVCMNVDKTSYDTVVQGVSRILSCDFCALFLYDQVTNSLLLKAANGYEDLPTELRIPITDETSVHVQAYLEEYLVHLPDLKQTQDSGPLSTDRGSTLVIPVIANQGPVGVFDFGNRTPDSFTPDDVSMASMLVDQMAYSLENIRLVGELSNSRDAVIRGMALLAEMRDEHIGGHLSRICAMARYLSEKLLEEGGYYEVTSRFIDELSRAAALHDVGKVGIPDGILLKPARFTPEEFEVMKSHSTTGANLLLGLIDDFGEHGVLGMGAAVARHHHERWDGKGYPDGLAGRDIPLAARIVSICDVYDALTSKRVYKEAWNYDETIEAMLAGRGTQFDPELLDIFLREPAELLAIQAQYPD